jgi:hypothetical protein
LTEKKIYFFALFISGEVEREVWVFGLEKNFPLDQGLEVEAYLATSAQAGKVILIV